MNIFNIIKQDIIAAAGQILNDTAILNQATIEIPKDSLNGDLSTNIAMIIASKEKVNPREIALKLKAILLHLPYIAHIEVAGAGFINFTIKPEIWHKTMAHILSGSEDFWSVNIGQGQAINVEYVSANPTGPMHIGHARGAVYGDVLARILAASGYNVTKEYYVNDAGAQVNDLINTVLLRYKEALTGEQIPIPEGCYPGEYLIPAGKKLAEQYGAELLSMQENEQYKLVKKFAVEEMLEIIKQDLKDLGVNHDIFFSEQSLHDQGKIDETVKLLTDLDLIYQGQLPPPKGKIDEEWQDRTQMLFRSSSYGDDQDRALQKSDGAWTYLAADLAYAKDKIDRGFDSLVYVLGADHSGYIKRIEAVVKALSQGKVGSDIKICQLVNFVENGVPIKMSKRSGNFTTVRDVINEVGKDVVRFIMLTRKNDAPLDFDLQKVREQSKDNPIFYVQYAHVRSLSIIAGSKDVNKDGHDKFVNNNFDLSLLSSEKELQLIKLLASWPKMLEAAAKYFEPHRVAFYLLNIAAEFHALWNFGKENNDYRFVIESNAELTAARLALAKATGMVLAKGFKLLGVTPLEKM